MLKVIFIALTIGAIIGQIPHVYYVFIKASKLKNVNSQRVQAGAFCLIMSVAIFGFVWMGQIELALLGATIEVIFNLYYYTEDFWQNGLRKRSSGEKKSIFKFWRQRWIYFFISVLIPAFIFTFSEILKGLM